MGHTGHPGLHSKTLYQENYEYLEKLLSEAVKVKP